ncbi:helix-turn-helix domain-containing protein [Streptomyces althioticus]|uniref:helix-turn-helix domain-containing protein n=1 Tax=Streptomyces althioticus TaxID=83380 RepID=UPI0033CA722C
MAHPTGKYADFEGLREQAVALRRAGLSRRQIRDRLHVDNNDILNRLLQGEPAPDWTRRPNAKDDLRARARELRLQGWTYDQIQVELGCSKSSISLWVRDLPKPERKRSRAEAAAIARRGWEAKLRLREEERQRTRADATSEIGSMTDRELFLLGVGLYWAEGSKRKPHNPQERVTFVNSDPDMISVFLAWLRLLDVDPAQIRFAVHIHESADVQGAEQFWADHVGVDRTGFLKTTLKRHNPATNRKNTGDTYRGCLRVDVRNGADLYRRIEGWWYGIVGAATSSDARNRT